MKLFIVIVMLLNMAWEIFLEVLDRRSLKRKIPACVSDVYDAEEYQKWRNYKREKDRLSMISGTVSFAVSLMLVLCNCYAAFAGLFPEGIYPQLLGVVLLMILVSQLVDIPFGIYKTFVIEEKYGFNKSTVKTFVVDTIKETILALMLTGGLVCIFALLYEAYGDWVILLFSGFIVLLSLVVTLIAPWLTRIFNKFTPLEDGPMKEQLMNLLTSHGYKVRAVEVMDASRRTTKMNAYFTGFGPMKTIVLYDTLVEAMSPEQICSVFAHELGHGLHHDLAKSRIFAVIGGLLTSACTWLLVSNPAFYTDFGFTGVNYAFAFLMVSWIMDLGMPLFNLLVNGQSRHAEYNADAQAVKEGYGESLASALKLLAKKNLSDLSPDPLLVKLTYSHPSLAQRIEAIEKQLKSNQ